MLSHHELYVKDKTFFKSPDFEMLCQQTPTGGMMAGSRGPKRRCDSVDRKSGLDRRLALRQFPDSACVAHPMTPEPRSSADQRAKNRLADRPVNRREMVEVAFPGATAALI
jgi:hypothetical protein